MFTVWGRRKIEVNTDPQRRCYNGCHARSEMRWTEWYDLVDSRTMEDAEDTIRTFQRANPTHEYEILPRGVSHA